MDKQKIDINTYKFQSGQTIAEILKSQTSWRTDRECLENLVRNNIRNVSDFADDKDRQALGKIDEALQNPDTDLRMLAVESDVATHYMCVKHFDQNAMNEGKRPYLTNVVNVSAQDDFPYELPKWLEDDLEEYPLRELGEEQKKMSYESHTENILQLGNTIGHWKDNFSDYKCQEAISKLENKKSGKELEADDFLLDIQNIMHVSEEKSHTVRHFINDEEYNLRISNHSANAIHAKNRPNETSIVIKLSSVKFRNSKDSYLAEYVYNSKNLTKDKQNGILNGLQDWLQTGHFTDTAYDKEFYSPSKELYLQKINENQTKLLRSNINELNLKDKELDIWTSYAQKSNEEIIELKEKIEEQAKTIQKQNQLLYGNTNIDVNGKTRNFPKGLIAGTPKCIEKLDEANQKILKLNSIIQSQQKSNHISPKSPSDDGGHSY